MPVGVGGTEDHVHLLVRLHPAVAVSVLVREVRGASSHLITHAVAQGEFFKWQGTYGAFTLRNDELQALKSYVVNEKQHHYGHTARSE